MPSLESIAVSSAFLETLGPLLLLAVRTGLVLAMAWVASRLVPASTTRHLIWVAAFAVLSLLPLLALAASRFVPAVEVGLIPAALAGDRGALVSQVGVMEETDVAARRESGDRPRSERVPAALEPSIASLLDTADRAGREAGVVVDGLALGDSASEGRASDVPGKAVVRASARSDTEWALALLVVAWLVGVAVLATRLGAGLWLRHRLLRTSRPADRHRRHRLRRLAAESGVAPPPRLLESDRVEIPMTWGARHPVVLLPRAARGWGDELLDSVLLHELAHVRRRDALVGLLAAAVRALYWPHPMVWGAYRALRRESELASDDAVIRSAVPPVRYAEHLLEVAAALRRSVPRAVAAMATRPQLPGRIGAILDASRRRADPGRATRLVLASTAVVALLATAVPVEPAARPTGPSGAFVTLGGAEATGALRGDAIGGRKSSGWEIDVEQRAAAASPGEDAPRGAVHSSRGTSAGSRSGLFDERCGTSPTSSSVTVEEDQYRIRAVQGRCELRIESSGAVELAADERGVRRMAPGGRLLIEERNLEGVRRWEATPGSDGRIEAVWKVDGETRAVGDESQAWLARMIPQVYRLTGWQAEERVGRILSDGGVDAVLSEVRLIFGDNVQAIYLVELLGQASLAAEEVRRWLTVAGREIGSDHELGKVLRRLPLDRLAEPGVQESFVVAASTIGSDHELRVTLEHLLRHAELSPELLRPLLEVAGTIGSDHELTELLIATCRRFPPHRQLPETFYDVAATIGSDHEMRRALSQLSGRPMESGDYERALRLARDIGSDFELAELVVELLDRLPRDAPLPRELFDTAATIGSDHQMGRVLARAIDRPLEADSLRRILELSHDIGSDLELAELLIGLVERHGDPVGARDAFEAAVESIGSRSQRDRVRSAWEHAGA